MASASASWTEREPERSWIFLSFRGATLSWGMRLISNNFRFGGLKNNIQISYQIENTYSLGQLIKSSHTSLPMKFLVIRFITCLIIIRHHLVHHITTMSIHITACLFTVHLIRVWQPREIRSIRF